MLASDPTQDGELIHRASEGDRLAFEDLVRRHGPAVQRLTRAILGDEAAAQDAAQEALLAAFRGASTWSAQQGPVRPWLLAIARHQAYRLRRRPVAEPLDEAPLLELGVNAGWSEESPEAEVSRAEAREHLSWALAALSAADREVLVLRELEGLSGAQTAAILGLDLAGMKSRLHRARLRLMAAVRQGSQPMSEQERLEGGLRCGQVLEVLSDYVDGQVSPQLREQVDQHLRGCSVCERFGGRFKRTVAEVRQHLGAAPAVDEAAYQQLLARWWTGSK